jgi:hypothetical protein
MWRAQLAVRIGLPLLVVAIIGVDRARRVREYERNSPYFLALGGAILGAAFLLLGREMIRALRRRRQEKLAYRRLLEERGVIRRR